MYGATFGKIGKLDELDCLKDMKNVWFLPHFPVTNVNKSGKLRLVFDAATRSKGKILDDFLVSGQDLVASATKDPWLR
jgi:hypothetical protein